MKPHTTMVTHPSWPRALLALGLLQLSVASSVHGQAQTAAQTAPQQSTLTPQEQLKKTVGFIRVPYRDQNGQISSVWGTCFFVVVLDDRLGKDRGFLYTVTNRHVATAEGTDPDALASEVYLYINRAKPERNQAIAKDVVQLTGTTHWYFPADATVDLAVLPVAPQPPAADITFLPVALFATSDVLKKQRIDIGDSVVFIGFFFQFPGTTRIEPIYRQGVIAMMPDDPIKMTDGIAHKFDTMEHLYLADAHAFHGNSGSPLFVQAGGFRNGSITAGSQFELMGVVNGFIPEETNVLVTGASTFESSDQPNSGILTFVPAQELRDFLYSPALQKMRDDAVAAQHKP
jgi:S1-C subfamily serine protease